MVAGTTGRGGEATVLIGSAEVGNEVSEGFVGFRFRAPIATGDGEQARGED